MESLTIREHPFDIVKNNLSLHRFQTHELILSLASSWITYCLLKRRTNNAILIASAVGISTFLYLIYTVRRTHKAEARNVGDYDQLTVYSEKMGNGIDKSNTSVLLTILTPLLDLLQIYLKGGSDPCTETKPIAITAFFRFWNSCRIYCPVDYTIPRQQIIGTNHVGYHPDLKNVDIRLIKDSFCFFPFFSSDQTHITTSIFPDILKVSSRVWNNIHIPEQKNKERRVIAVNKLYSHVRAKVEDNVPLSVVVFMSGHSRQNCSIFHWQPFYDGCACMALLTGVPIVLLFNAYFRTVDNKEHFRQIISKPIHVKKLPSDEHFDFQIFKQRNKNTVEELNKKIAEELTTLTKTLRNLYHLHDSDLNTHPWKVDSENKNCPICH